MRARPSAPTHLARQSASATPSPGPASRAAAHARPHSTFPHTPLSRTTRDGGSDFASHPNKGDFAPPDTRLRLHILRHAKKQGSPSSAGSGPASIAQGGRGDWRGDSGRGRPPLRPRLAATAGLQAYRIACSSCRQVEREVSRHVEREVSRQVEREVSRKVEREVSRKVEREVSTERRCP